MYRFALPLILVMLFSAPATAEPSLLTNDALQQAFTGSNVHVDTPLGLILKIDYGADGTLSGDAGHLAFYMGSAKDHGRWWIENNEICHKWSRWFDRERNCLKIRATGQRIAWRRDDGEQGTATIVAGPVFVQAQVMPAPRPAAQRIRQAESHSPQAKPAVPAKPTSAANAKPVTATKTFTKSKIGKAPAVKVDPVPATPSEPTFRVVGVPDFDVLNVRAGPSADYAAVGTIAPNGRRIRLAGRCRDDWCVVAHKGTRGWVNRYYLSIETPMASAKR